MKIFFLSFVTMWVNLEDIALRKIRQMQKYKCFVTSLICGILKSQTQRSRAVTRSWQRGCGKGKCWSKGIRFQLDVRNKFSKLYCTAWWQLIIMYHVLENCWEWILNVFSTNKNGNYVKCYTYELAWFW